MFNAFDLINLFYFTALMLFLWSAKTHSVYYAIFEFMIAFLFALFFETYNISISGHYSYPNTYFYIGEVSLEVLIGWYTVFLIGKYWITVLITFIDEKKAKTLSSLYPLFILANAYISSTFVMLIDPFASRTKWWEWFESSPFLGVPVGEIYGVFISMVVITTLLITLKKFLSSYLASDVYVRKNLDKYDLVIFLIYEIFCLLGLILTISIATSDDDVLMGVTIVYLATQIIPFVVMIFYLSSSSFDEKFNFYVSNKKAIVQFLLASLVIVTAGVSLVASLAIFRILNPFLSFHMVMTQFSMVLIGITIFFLQKYYKFTSQSNNSLE